MIWAAAPGNASDRPLAPLPVPTISVIGEGRAEAVPDIAGIRIGVTAQAETAAEALAQASEAVRATLARLDAAGIAPRDRQTTGLSLQPVWHYAREGDTPPRITGYRAENGISVRVRVLDDLGRVLDGVVADGANRLEGLTFSLADPEPLRDEARRRAVADARARAELYAEAAGIGLGAVLTISEGQASAPAAPMMRSDIAMISEAAVPIAEGALEITARVQMVFTIAE
jgi:uncharacterized protein YggE